MERYGEIWRIGTRLDPSHYRKYEVLLEAEIRGCIDAICLEMKSLGYILADFDQGGLTYLKNNDRNLTVDVEDFEDRSRLLLRKGNIVERDIESAIKYVERACHIIARNKEEAPSISDNFVDAEDYMSSYCIHTSSRKHCEVQPSRKQATQFVGLL